MGKCKVKQTLKINCTNQVTINYLETSKTKKPKTCPTRQTGWPNLFQCLFLVSRIGNYLFIEILSYYFTQQLQISPDFEVDLHCNPASRQYNRTVTEVG